jgi:hypothetical protein
MMDFWSAITVANRSATIDDLFQVADQLPMPEKIALAKRLLGNDASVSIVVGNQQLTGNIVIQINSMDKDALSELLTAIANRIAEDAGAKQDAPSPNGAEGL